MENIESNLKIPTIQYSSNITTSIPNPIPNNESNLFYNPKREGLNTIGRKITIACNYFKISTNLNTNKIYKYSFSYLPDIPITDIKLRKRTWKIAKPHIELNLGQIVNHQDFIYSLNCLGESLENLTFTLYIDDCQFNN